MKMIAGFALGLLAAGVSVGIGAIVLAVRHRRQVERIIAACRAADAVEPPADEPTLTVETSVDVVGLGAHGEPIVATTETIADAVAVARLRPSLDPQCDLARYIADQCAMTGRTIVLTDTFAPILMHHDHGRC